MGSPDIVNDRPVKGPSTDHAYSLAKAYGDLAIEQTYDIPQLRENAELARQLESMLSHAMQAVHDIAEDNKLWDALRSAREGIDSRRFEDLIGFTQLSLEPLLSASGCPWNLSSAPPATSLRLRSTNWSAERKPH